MSSAFKWIGVGVIMTVATTSSALGWLESKADVVFLATLVTSVVSTAIGALSYSLYDKTSGNDSGTVSAFLSLFGNGAAIIAAFFLTLILGHALLIGGIACGAILVWNAFLTYGLIA